MDAPVVAHAVASPAAPETLRRSSTRSRLSGLLALLVAFVVVIAVAGEETNIPAGRRRSRYADSLNRPGDMRAVRRDGHGVERSNTIELVEEGVVALLRVCE